MPTQSSLKARALVILERTTQRPVSAQSQKDAAQYPQIAHKTINSQCSDIEIIRTWLNHIGEPEEDHYVVLDKCKCGPEALAYYLEWAIEYEFEKRQQKVLNMLAENPDKKQIYTTDTTTDQHNVILTIAIRGVAAFEVLIPKAKYDPFLFIEIIDKYLQ